MDNINRTEEAESESSLSCDLTGLPSFILQFVLGLIAISTLLIKRCKEPKTIRRPVFIWMADALKQAIGMLGAHFCNLLLAQLLPIHQIDHCILYLMNFLLDSTFGILIIYVLFKIIKFAVKYWKITPLITGEYGEPFKFHYWLAQCSVVLLVMLTMKLIIGPLTIFSFWGKVGTILLPFQNKELRTAIVIFIVPFIVNVVMFWIVDSIIMRSNQLTRGAKNQRQNSPPVTFRKKRQTIYLPLSNRDVPDEETIIPSDSDHSLINR